MAKARKNRFIIFSIALFLSIFIAGGGIFFLFMQQLIRTNKGNELTQILEIQRLKLELLVSNEISIVLKMAGSPLIQDFFSDPKNNELRKMALKEIAGYRKAFASHFVFWISDKDRMFNSDGNKPYYVNIDDPGNYWYSMTLNKTEKYNFNINYNPDIKATKLWVNAPVLNSGLTPVGMVGTGIDLSEFVDTMYKDNTSKVKLYFFNALGEITGANNIELITAKKNINSELSEEDSDIVAIAKNLEPNKVQTIDTKSGKIAIGSLSLLGWYSVAFMPDSIKDYKTNITGLFIVMMVVMAIAFAMFNIFILRLLKPLHKTMDALKEASKAKSDFLAKMSHEIRTPMNAIIGMAELALRKNMSDAVREHIITVKQAGNNLLSIINDILDISKIESGKLEIVPGDYQFSSLINDVVSIIRMRIIDSSISFVVNIDSRIPSSLFGDETRIRQVLLNILSNAVKYTKKGFVSFSVSGKINEGTVLLTIDVSDSGSGVKPEDLKKLFGEFVQVDLATHKGVEGTGLGLAITKNLIKMMDGDIKVRSEYGRGSSFIITLPQKIRSLKPVAEVENPKEKKVLVYELNKIYAGSIAGTVGNLGVECECVESDEELRKKLKKENYTFLLVSYPKFENAKKIIQELDSKTKMVVLTEFGNAVVDVDLSILPMPVHSISIANILNGVTDKFSYSSNENSAIRIIAPNAKILVVDDIETNLKVAKGLMQPYKMKMDSRLSGAEAIEAIKANNYDLVFMDHMMPEMDGVEATKIIREMGGYENLPIIALTANAVSGTKEMFLANGFNDFISKPIDMVNLNSILEKWLPKEKQEKVKEAIHENDLNTDFEIDGIDVKKGIFMSGGTLKGYIEILSTFRKDGIAKIDEIKKCLETNNYPLYITHVHALKSASANIGASDLSEIARSLEIAGKNEDFAYIEQYNPEFLKTFDVLLNNINTALLANKKNEQVPVDFESLKRELNKLKAAIGAYDSGVIDATVNTLRSFTQAADIGDSIESILQKILIGEYDEAVAIIDAINPSAESQLMLDAEQTEKLLKGNQTFSYLSFSMLLMRMRMLYSKDPSPETLQQCNKEISAFLKKYKFNLSADALTLEKI